MSEYLVVEGGDNITYQSDLVDYGNIGNEYDRYFKFDKPITNSNIYVENNTIENVQVDLLYEDKLVYTGYFWQYNYLDFYVDENSYVDLIIVHGNNEGQNQDVNIKVKDLSNYNDWFKDRFKERFTNVVFSNDRISANINIENKEKWVFTSIGYDKGWKVEVNGKQVETSKVQLGFVGFKLQPGNHDVLFYYETPFLKLGITISVLSLLVLLFINKRRLNK